MDKGWRCGSETRLRADTSPTRQRNPRGQRLGLKGTRVITIEIDLALGLPYFDLTPIGTRVLWVLARLAEKCRGRAVGGGNAVCGWSVWDAQVGRRR
jgi:hypothetical protein